MLRSDLCDYSVDDNASDGKSFKYNTKIIGKTEERPAPPGPDDGQPQPQPPIPPLNTELDFKWTKNCVLAEEEDNITGVSLTNTSPKLYVPVVTLSINDNIKILEHIKQEFKRTIS